MSYPIPNTSPSHVIQQPGLGAIVADGIGGLVSSLALRHKFEQGRLQQSVDQQNANTLAGQLYARNREEAYKQFSDLDAQPNLHGSPEWSRSAILAGFNPGSLMAARRENEARAQAGLEKALKDFPEMDRNALRTILSLSVNPAIKELPAEARTQIFGKVFGETRQGGASVFFQGLKSGLRADVAAEIAGIQRPATIAPDFMLPDEARGSDQSDIAANRRMTRLTANLSALRQQINDAESRIEKKASEFLGLPRFRAGVPESGPLHDEYERMLSGWARNNYPSLTTWRRRVTQTLVEIDQLSGVGSSQPSFNDVVGGSTPPPALVATAPAVSPGGSLVKKPNPAAPTPVVPTSAPDIPNTGVAQYTRADSTLPKPARRRITADQREFLKARGQWNPNLYEVVE
jgi:hypothetical protein